MQSECDVAVIGAGPYGLSVAAHLKAQGLILRVFGRPMDTWLTQMPQGMRLKSEGFASSLSDPQASFTLEEYCRQQNIPYADIGSPVPIETFIGYGLAFQKKFLPELENKLVNAIKPVPGGFRLRLEEDGEEFFARQVVVAAGLSHFSFMPEVLAGLPKEYVTHSSRHSRLECFAGRKVAVIGAGASAIDLAALLHESGAEVQIIARKPAIRFHDPPRKRSLLDKLRAPLTGIGSGWNILFCTRRPHWFRRLPQQFRLDFVKRTLGPAPGWFVKLQVVGKVPMLLGVNIAEADIQNNQVRLKLVDSTGGSQTVLADHVIAATGFKVDLHRLAFLTPTLLSQIESVEETPVLSSHFESSVPGLYFVGVAAANTFGPVLRFAYGAAYTAKRISACVARVAKRQQSQMNAANAAGHPSMDVTSPAQGVEADGQFVTR
jgi:thioredoxin reductase